MSGVSAFKNAVQRRTHKERAQPYARSKLGLLEKHKDYKQRAKDYHRKQDHLQHLKGLAVFKNPDEFYHKMISSTTKDGVHVVAKNNTKTTATVAKWKLQDAGYLQNRIVHTNSQIEKLEACLSLSLATPQDSKDDSSDEEEDAPPAKRKKILEGDNLNLTDPCANIVNATPIKLSVVTDKKLSRKTASERRKLEELRKTRTLLTEELQKLQRQRSLIGSKGQVQKIVKEDKFGNEDPKLTVYKWKMQRTK